jgi:hypothetical protein
MSGLGSALCACVDAEGVHVHCAEGKYLACILDLHLHLTMGLEYLGPMDVLLRLAAWLSV